MKLRGNYKTDYNWVKKYQDYKCNIVALQLLG